MGVNNNGELAVHMQEGPVAGGRVRVGPGARNGPSDHRGRGSGAVVMVWVT